MMVHHGGGDSYRPQYRRDDGPPPPPADVFQFRGAASGRDRRDADGRSDFTFRARPKISERPLLRTRRGSKEEPVLGDAHAQGDKFRNLDELTDSDEAEMEDSDDDDHDDEKPSAKRARVDTESAKPKWSNPDVYTSLPAPSETTGKKVDFVKLIRKAKNSSTKSQDLIVNDEDFISFGDTNGDDAAPLNAPTGPRMQDTDRALGKRKRGETSGTKIISRHGKNFYEDGMVLDEWLATDKVHPTPWLRLHARDGPGLALHKEILDFYDWVKPRDYEFQVRAGVVDRLSKALNRIEPGDLKAFGSYAAGLYLPTGDMDLVYLCRGFQTRQVFQNGVPHGRFRKFGEFIKKQGIAQAGSVNMIAHAKVPIIKFVERVSGLKVDLSFNNDTGVVAIDTFRKWREQYPAMPILVAVVKQFLMIRGLNDVAVGGLGGFSAICLVTSLLQHMPLSSSPPNLGQALLEFFNLYGNLFDRDSVGIRLEPPGYVDKKSFSRIMGNQKDKVGRLMIVDPNRADNNISGGTSAIQTIFTCFSRAHEVLQNRLADYDDHDPSSGHGFSFLEDLVGGDFTAYQAQRDILYGLHYGRTGPAPAVIPPPPPPPTRDPLPPPPPPPEPTRISKKSDQAARSQDRVPSSDDASSATKTQGKRQSKGEKRAMRLKSLRPELVSSIGQTISLPAAVEVGGYTDFNEMDRDLRRREHDLNSN